MDNKESELYNSYLEALIKETQKNDPSTATLKLINEFLKENQIGANPTEHKQTQELAKAKLPFNDENEDSVIPLRTKTK